MEESAVRTRVKARRRAVLLAAGVGLLAIPVGFFCLFAVGEVASGDWSGLSHLVQAFPIVLLGLAALRWPTGAGAILLVVGLVVMTAYAAVTADRFEAATIAIVEIVLAFPVVSGGLLVLAGRSSRDGLRSLPRDGS
jgi:hypothetical protein